MEFAYYTQLAHADDAATLVEHDVAPHHALKSKLAAVDNVKTTTGYDMFAHMRQHTKPARGRRPLTDRVLAISRDRPSSASSRRGSLDASSPYHVSVCRTFAKTGSCPYGDACSFEHIVPRARAAPSPSPARRASVTSTEKEVRYLPVPAVPPMFYSTYRRGSNGEIIDPSLLPAPVQQQKSLYYRTKPCRYWTVDGVCPKGDKCTFIHDPALGATNSSPTSTPGPATPTDSRSPERRHHTPQPKAPREPHPAWRVVGGGVTLAAMHSPEDQQDEEDVETMMQLDASQSQSSQPQGYVAPLPSPAAPQATFAAASPYAMAAPPGAPMFAYAYPAPSTPYFFPAPSDADRRQSIFVPVPVPVPVPAEHYAGMMPYYVAATPNAISFEVPRTEDNMDTLAAYAVDVSGVDGSARPFDAPEPEHLELCDPDVELEIDNGDVLLDPPESQSGGYPWGLDDFTMTKMSWADEVEQNERDDAGVRTTPNTPRRMYQLFAAAESP